MTAHKWLAPEDKYLRKYYPACGAKIVADALGIDDKRFITTFHLRAEPVKDGAVIVSIAPYPTNDV